MNYSESGVEEPVSIQAVQETTIFLMGDEPVHSQTPKVEFLTHGIRVRVEGGTDFYPYFNVTKVETRTVILDAV